MEFGCGTHPFVGVDGSTGSLDVRGDGGVVPAPEPDLDRGSRALHRIEPSTGRVERLPIALGDGGLDTTARIAVRCNITVVRDRFPVI